MRLTFDMTALDDLRDEIEELDDMGAEASVKTMNFIARSTQQQALYQIRSAPKSGRVYQTDRGAHRASAPGESPADDTGLLASSIRAYLVSSVHDEASVGTDLRYGEELEHGFLNNEGRYVDPRPWLLPAFNEALERASGRLKEEFDKLL